MDNNALFMAGSVYFVLVCFFSTAFFTGWLAGKKGYGFGIWGALGFFFGFVALLTIGFAPKNNNYENYNYSEKNINTRWKCPKCNNENPSSTFQCGSCGYKLK